MCIVTWAGEAHAIGFQAQKPEQARNRLVWAMMTGLALWLLELAMDAQYARNSLFPEDSDSPIVMLSLIKVVATLEQLLRTPQCPLGALHPSPGPVRQWPQ